MISSVAKVTPADLEGMDNLTILYLHDNIVKDMGASLKGLQSLTLLDISSNKLTKVECVHMCVFVHMSNEVNGQSVLSCIKLIPGPCCSS